MTEYSFRLDCVPTAQARPRHARAKNGLDVTYKSQRQKENEARFEAELAIYRPKEPLSGGLCLIFKANMPLPARFSRKCRERLLSGEAGHTVKPDLDNLAKQLKDAMTRQRYWLDDSQITLLVCEKAYSETPGWEVTLKQICRARQEIL